MMYRKTSIDNPAFRLLICLFFIAAVLQNSFSQTFSGPYPVTRRTDVSESFFGEKVSDPYRWLEDDTSREVKNWVNAQNKITFSYLNKIPFRAQLRKRIERLNNYEKLSAPTRHGDHIYYYRNSGLQNHSVLYRKKNDDDKEEVFLDPNLFSADGTTRMTGVHFSKDGSRVAYQISRGGADWTDAIVMSTADKKILEDTIRNIKFSGISWKGNDGFYFSTYETPGGSLLSAKTANHKLYYHQVGTPRFRDKLVFGDNDRMRRYVNAMVTDDERFLVISAANTTTGNELFIADLNEPSLVLYNVVDHMLNENNVIGNEGDRIYMMTNIDAPKNRIVSFPFSNPISSNWSNVVPEGENVFKASMGGGYIFAEYSVDVKTEVRQFDLQGRKIRDVLLPGIGTASGFEAKKEDTILFYSFTSFTWPTTIYKYRISDGSSFLHVKPKVDFNPEDFETKQVFYKSKDGTRIPMFIVYKKGLVLNGMNPAWLYGYGGFGVSLNPTFGPSRIAWLENGGIYAQPNLRGGGEYGENWHLAGTKMNKQNVFDDFVAAGEFLIREKYTSSRYLAIAGGSNGGLLVGAVMSQRPDLVKVALPAVGVLDMLRYHKFTAGAGWAYDYGTVNDSKEMFEYLKKYSPLHALRAGVSYPATMVITADHDDRVVPAHSYKFAATLQEKNKGSNPVLIRVDVKSGHGTSNLSKAIELTADQFSFALWNMGIKYKPIK